MGEYSRQQPDQQAGNRQGYQQAGPARAQQLQCNAQQQRTQTQHQRRPVYFSCVFQQAFQGLQRSGLAGQIQPQQARQLSQGDDHCGAEGKAQYHRMRDKIDQCAETQHSQQPLKHSGEERKQQDQGDVVVTAADSQGADAGIEHNGNRRRRPADQVPGRTPEAGNQHRDNRCIQAIFGRQAGD
ncbi:hypothetical protein D3C78_761430 [compost metagenome]